MPPEPGHGGVHRKRYAVLRQVILDDLGPTRRVEVRRRMARFLRELADELESERQHGWSGAGGPPGDGIRWNGVELLIGQILWRGIGAPKRIAFDVKGTTTWITADAGGYSVRKTGFSCAHVACKRVWHHAQWAEGWRPGRVEAGAIVFDGEATEA